MIRSPIISVLGHVDHGKCVSPDTQIYLANGKILTAEKIYKIYKRKTKLIGDGFVCKVNGPQIFTFDGKGIGRAKISHLWKLKAPHTLVKIKLENGREIKTTPEHPFLTSNGYKSANNISLKDFVLIPKENFKKVCFAKVECKEIFKNETAFVYDFTVPQTNNFVAEGFFVHNTTLLDKIRGTAVAASEPGLITQYISASYVPTTIIKAQAGPLLEKLKITLDIPGLLWIDIPGHAAFTTLRKRGGAIADLAVLVIDCMEGFQPQTDESLTFLKQFKTPFVIALTKIDKIAGWKALPNSPFVTSFDLQAKIAQNGLEEKLYKVVAQLSERGFAAERYDRVTNFSKQIAIVPVSGITGEGIADLLVVVGGIAQKFLKGRLTVTPGTGKGVVLELKPFRGLGMTADIILYDGSVEEGDWLIIGGAKPIKTKIKAILLPAPLKELREEKLFQRVKRIYAASGVKIAASDLENVIPGSPLRTIKNEKEIDQALKDVQAEIEEVEITTEKEGVLLKADTLGSLEALIKCIKELGLAIRAAHVGTVTKADIMELKLLKKPIIFAFGITISDDIAKLAADNGITIFSSNVIYKLIEDYKVWEAASKAREEEALLLKLPRPAKIKVLPGYIFRQSKPAIFGIEVLAGTLRVGVKLKKGQKIVGEVKEIQSEGKPLTEAVAGNRVAISMMDVVIGKDVLEGDILNVRLASHEIEKLKKLKARLRPDEIELIESYE
jgi:translation initiation factor 5B